MSTDGLSSLFAPRSVALVGASDDPGKWGQWLVPGLVRGAARRPLTLVNRRVDRIAGLPTVPSLLDAGTPPELVVVCVPPAQVESALRDAVEVGARGAIVITAGIDAIVGDGGEAAMVGHAVAGGMRVIGPNCFGMYDADSELQVTWSRVRPGGLAVVSQSGAVGMECIGTANESGLGVSRFVSLGNQRDVSAADVLADLVHHDATKVVALYVESFGDGRLLIEAMQALRDAGKPTVLLTVGTSTAGSRAARSHTNSTTSAAELVDAACRAAGTVRVSSPWELVDVARVLAGPVRPRGRRAAVVGDSGGQGAIAADLLHAQQLEVPPFNDGTQALLRESLAYTAAVANPVDLGGGGAVDAANYVTIVEAAARSGDVDLVLLTGYFGAFAGDTVGADDEIRAAHRMIDTARDTGVPIVVHCQVPGSPTLDEFHAHGVATFPSIERATRAAGVATRVATATARPLHLPPTGGGSASDGSTGGDADAWRAVVDLAGVPPRDGSMAAGDGVELRIGVHRDAVFGPVVVLAAGGDEGEVWDDRTVELGPVTADVAASMVRRLRSARLLDGWRGRPAADVDTFCRLVEAVSRYLYDRDGVVEVALDPVQVGVDGVRIGRVQVIRTDS